MIADRLYPVHKVYRFGRLGTHKALLKIVVRGAGGKLNGSERSKELGERNCILALLPLCKATREDAIAMAPSQSSQDSSV